MNVCIYTETYIYTVFIFMHPLRSKARLLEDFSKIAKIREKARKAFIRVDMSSRVRRAILRKSAPISKEYGVGDLVCFRTDQLGWFTVSRIIGFDGSKAVNAANDTSHSWHLGSKGTLACVALDRLRPVNASEALAHQYLSGQNCRWHLHPCQVKINISNFVYFGDQKPQGKS